MAVVAPKFGIVPHKEEAKVTSKSQLTVPLSLSSQCRHQCLLLSSKFLTTFSLNQFSKIGAGLRLSIDQIVNTIVIYIIVCTLHFKFN